VGRYENHAAHIRDRGCGVDGIHNTRTAVYCNGLDGTADPALLAQFPAALAEAWVVGTCAPGWYGRPRLYCGLDGQYDTANLVNPCSNGTCIEQMTTVRSLSHTHTRMRA
jgi:hypothetical protein